MLRWLLQVFPSLSYAILRYAVPDVCCAHLFLRSGQTSTEASIGQIPLFGAAIPICLPEN